MYISGSIKKKTIEFYKPNIISFGENELMTDKIVLTYDGELLVLPWNITLEKKLIAKQESLISQGIDKTLFVSNKKFTNINAKIKQTLQKIERTDRRYTFILFECFYNLIILSLNKEELMIRVEEFENFINWLETEEINQIDLDILISLFLNKKEYDQESLKIAKEKKFQIIEEEILTESLNKIITFGEFISPNRVPKVANTLATDIESSKLVLPIYFAIPNELDANKFLNLCRTPDLDETLVKKNATRLRIPSNIQNLIR